MKNISLKEWYENCTSPEFRDDIISYRNIDFDALDYFLPESIKSSITESDELMIFSRVEKNMLLFDIAWKRNGVILWKMPVIDFNSKSLHEKKQ